MSSSLSVITLPEFSTKQYQATDTKRKLETQDIQTCSNHSSYTDVRTNQETGSQENSRNVDEFASSHNVSIIDFSKPIDISTPQSHRHGIQSSVLNDSNTVQGHSSNKIQKVQGHVSNQKNTSALALSYIPLADISKIKSSPKANNVNNTDLQMTKDIPKTVGMLNGKQDYGHINTVSQKLNTTDTGHNIPKTLASPHERKVPIIKTRPKLMRIKSLVVTKEKKNDVKCGICQQKLESCADILSHSKLHDLDLACCVCEAKFASYCNMRRHCAGHVQTILYMCSLCHCAYKRKDNLQTHIKKHYLHSSGTFTGRHHMKYPHLRSLSQSTKTFVLTKDSNMANQKRADKGGTANSQHENEQSNCTITRVERGPEIRESNSLSNAEDHQIDLTSDDEQIKDSDKMNVDESDTKLQDMEVNISSNHDMQPKNLTITNHDLESNMATNSIQLENEAEKKHQSTYESDRVVSLAESTCNTQENISVSNQILNYCCSSCGVNFDQLENLRRHIFSSHSEEIPNQSENNEVDASVLNLDPIKIELFEENNSQNKVMENEMQIIDIGKLSEFSGQYNPLNQSNEIRPEDLNLAMYSADGNFQTPPMGNPFGEAYHNSSAKSLKGFKKGRHGDRLDSITPICRICGIMFKDVQQVIDHKFEHPVEIPQAYGCTICNADLSSKECLRRHIRNHMGEEYQCYYCQSKYNRKDNLYAHMKNSHGWIRPCKNPGPSLYYNTYATPK